VVLSRFVLVVLFLLFLLPMPVHAQTREVSGSVNALARDMRRGLILRGRTEHRLVHFTFDDGPRLETSARLLDSLDRAGIKATFFLVARQMEGRGRYADQAELAREMVRRGHTIGLHGYDHTRLTELGEHEIRDQLTRSEAVFEDVLGERPWLFRPPYGHRDDKSDAIMAEAGYTQVLWMITAEGDGVRTSDQLLERFRRNLDARERSRYPGGFVLLHDRHDWVVDSVPAMVAELAARNCELLARGEELWDVVDDPRIFFVRRGELPANEVAPPIDIDEVELAARQARLRERARRTCPAR
jgi:peptidoglycan/xylan/chitin deacetylase (PgdA/CDA1 family)